MSLAASIQYRTVSHLCSLGFELTKLGFYLMLVSPKRMKSIFSSLACIFPFITAIVWSTSSKWAQDTQILRKVCSRQGQEWRGCQWEPAGGGFGMGAKMMHFHLVVKCTSGKTDEIWPSWESNWRSIRSGRIFTVHFENPYFDIFKYPVMVQMFRV